jgi:hypothetical protein
MDTGITLYLLSLGKKFSFQQGKPQACLANSLLILQEEVISIHSNSSRKFRWGIFCCGLNVSPRGPYAKGLLTRLWHLGK